MEQFEQLLTCCVCLDRYRNPKLLPCQHSFCMEPCMDGLIDYVKRQVKCPECRAEHRIPYQGVQGFPTNVTLQRFLELHIEISGELPDPTANQIMERCNVCSEKSYCSSCGHCDKKVCNDCKGAHMDILRREIARINNQVRRGLHRLQDIYAVVEKNALNLQTNCTSVSEEVDEINRRLGKALKDRTEYLRCEIDRYLGTELRNLTTLKDNLELEIANITSNCDLADKHINEDVEWDDTELMDTKEIFLKTVEFIRNFEYEASDYSRRVRFVMAHDPNQLVLHVAGYGELNINTANTGFSLGGSSGNSLLQVSGPGLMRSKSDHRLASQFRQQEESRGYGDKFGEPDEPLLGGRKFGDPRPKQNTDKYSDRYGRSGNEYGEDYSYDTESSRPRRFRSRFVKSQQGDDSDNEQSSKAVKFDQAQKDKEKVFDTEDVARGPLSGIFRLTDSPRVMKRLQECDPGKKKVVKETPPQVLAPPPAKPALKKPPVAAPPPAQRQVSEDDEISKIKKQNKGASSSATTEIPAAERVAALKQRPEEEERRRPTREASSDAESDESAGSHQIQRKTSTATPAATVTKAGSVPRRASGAESPSHVKATRSDSSESSTSSESATTTTTVAAKSTEADKKETASSPGGGQRFQSRFLGSGNRTATPAPVEPPKKEETETSSEEETDSSEESEDETGRQTENQAMAKTDIGPLLARSSNARETAQENKANKDGSPSYTSKPSSYSKPEETPKYRTRPPPQEEEPASSRYGSSGSSYTSRFLNRGKGTVASADEDDNKYGTSKTEDDSDKYPTNRSRYLAMKERRNRLARSRSSHTGFGGTNDDDDLDEPVSPTTASPSAYLASRYGTSSSGNDLARSRSSHALKSRENSPERTSTVGGEKDGAALSSWARYLKSKYGNRAAKDRERDGAASGGLSPSSSSAARRLSLGLPLRSANELTSSDDDQKNAAGSPISPTAATAVAAGFAAAGSSPRSQYLQKRRQLFKVGSRGSEPGTFTWPRGIAVGPDNTMVVADSSNHRVQVFDSNGVFMKEFGSYGSGEGEFDCLAGVAVNRIGQYIIADRYNHRIQVLDPSGRFLRAFGSQGTADGRFNYPWGITTDALGFIYVCDKENHRVQVFQSDGTFVGKFGSFGHKAGQLEHPHYIAVSSTNRVIVSDSNNHRVQIFDVNGRVLSSFGSEGSEEGQFKFPRGVAVDDQGYICVADSGNNRIQIFHPDGTFLRAFGSWGSGDAEFKGLEGIAVMSNGNIIVCDRENHRVQVF